MHYNIGVNLTADLAFIEITAGENACRISEGSVTAAD